MYHTDFTYLSPKGHCRRAHRDEVPASMRSMCTYIHVHIHTLCTHILHTCRLFGFHGLIICVCLDHICLCITLVPVSQESTLLPKIRPYQATQFVRGKFVDLIAYLVHIRHQTSDISSRECVSRINDFLVQVAPEYPAARIHGVQRYLVV